MSLEIQNTSVGDIRGINAVANSRQNSSVASGMEEEEAYSVSKSGDKPSRFEVDYDKIRSLKADYRKGYSAFRHMVSTLLQKQGQKSQDVLKKIFGENGNFEGVTDLGKVMASLDVDDETRAQAASLIGENGDLGVNQVSKNILDFAKAASGGDPSKIEELKQAFLKGFSEAERVWGGSLPQISYQTKQAVLKGFEDWEKSNTAQM